MHQNRKEALLTELAEIARLIDAGKLKVALDRAFPFAEIDDAFAYLEKSHAKGKVVVRIALGNAEHLTVCKLRFLAHPSGVEKSKTPTPSSSNGAIGLG